MIQWDHIETAFVEVSQHGHRPVHINRHAHICLPVGQTASKADTSLKHVL